MSYSFMARGADKAAALADVEAKFDQVVASQPIHAADKVAVLANAAAVVDILADDPEKDVIVSCDGWVTWTNSIESPVFVGVAVACSAAHAQKE